MYQIWRKSKHEKIIFCTLKLFNFGAKKKKKNTKKIRRFLRTNISQTTSAISLKFGVRDDVYVDHKIYKFDRIWLRSYRDMEGGNRKNSGSCKYTHLCTRVSLGRTTHDRVSWCTNYPVGVLVMIIWQLSLVTRRKWKFCLIKLIEEQIYLVILKR